MKTLYFAVLVLLVTTNCISSTSKKKVEFKNDENGKKVEVYIGDKFFTAYIYPDDMEKQSLYPIVSASGKTVTRGYPLNPRPFERIDHPHHLASSLAHLGNISYRFGRQLEFDPVAERFIGDGESESNSMLTRDYRAPYLLPEIV